MSCHTFRIILLLVSGAIVQIRSQTPWKVEYASKYELKFFDQAAANFDAAKSLCSRNEGYVVRMDDVEVRGKVYSIIPSATNVVYFWIGATGRLRSWTWLGETSLANTNDFIIWRNGQPDNYHGTEHNLLIRIGDMKYADVDEALSYAGTICQRRIDHYCAAHRNTCSHGGACTSTMMSPFFSCECTDGYYGYRCTDQYCAAHPNTCKNGGLCTSALTSPLYSCRCSTGYYGDTCTERYCAAHRYTCKNRGVCMSTFTSPFFSCRCKDGYYGNTCSEQYCEAHPNTCSHGSTCTSTMMSPFFSCICTDGYYGYRCTYQYCAAHPNTCKNSGLCTSTFTSPFYSCRCSDGYYGDTCTRTEQYCSVHQNPCGNGGTCFSETISPFYSCRCDKGYYGNMCAEFLQISTPPKAIGVVGDNILSIGVTVNTTRGGVILTLFKKNFKKHSTQLIENVTNGDAHFNLYDITKGNRGNYRISAKVEFPNYTTRAEFMVIIHENATINYVNPQFTYTPKTTGMNLITCNATGIPAPDVSWYRAGSLVTSSGSYGGVFQFKTNPKIYERVAYLNVTNAELSDNGTYLCKVTNIVGSDKRTIISKAWADLAVYGSPMIQNVSPTPCSINGTVEVEWKPNNQTNGVKHRLSLRSLNTTIPHIVSSTTIDKQVRFDQLLPLTTYQIQITVCPEECISKLNASTTVKTGVGLPGEVYSPSLHKDDGSSECIVTWNWPKKTPSDLISHTEVSWKANKVYRADNNPAHETMEIHSTNVSPPTLLSNISTVPNRKYSVSVRAFTCAGPGVSVIANGSCVTDAEEQYCAAHPNTCSHGGTCTSTMTSPFFSCRCTDGYYGDTCSGLKRKVNREDITVIQAEIVEDLKRIADSIERLVELAELFVTGK